MKNKKRNKLMCRKVLASALTLSILLSGCGAGASESAESDISAGSMTDEQFESPEEMASAASSDSTSGDAADTEQTDTDAESESAYESTDTDTSTADGTSAGQLSEEEKEALRSQLLILQDYERYTYQNMLDDTVILEQLYPDLFTQNTIGTTADGRSIVHYVVGNPSAEKQIFINGAIHAREYLTFQLVMKQMAVYLQHVDDQDVWGDMTYQDMWNQVAIHVVPLVNPDGVQICQFGLDGIQTDSVREEIYSLAANDGSDVTTYYLEHWKANASGVDLNRNFDAYWESYAGTGYPSSDHYKGEYPGSEPEAAALIQLTEANHFLYTISYHTQGQVIYWNFENIDPVYDISLQWVNRLVSQTGYSPVNDFSTVDPAGYSDWAIYRHQIPSTVIEVASGESPYLSNQFQQVWQENLNVWEITIDEAINSR